MRLNIFMKNEIIEIANKINKAGGRLYLVGGAVRDEIMRTRVKR